MSTIKQGITDLIEAKQALEARLHDAIKAEIDAFHLMTGLAVESVSIDMYSMRSVIAPIERRVSSVRVSVPLD